MRTSWREGWPVATLLGGFALWSAAFVLLYGAQATGCRLGWHLVGIGGGVSLQRALLVLLFLATLALHAVLALALRRAARASPREGAQAFTRQTAHLLALAALGASLFCFAGVFWLSAC